MGLIAMSELAQRMLSADLAVKRAREVFSERRAGRPGEWKKVHLTFDELALILLQTLNDPRNLGDRK